MKTLILSLLFVSVIGAANCQDYDQKEIQNLRVEVESIKVELNIIIIHLIGRILLIQL